MNEGFHDSVGGYHEAGVGYNPNGVFCGECTSATCEGCQYVAKDTECGKTAD